MKYSKLAAYLCLTGVLASLGAAGCSDDDDDGSGGTAGASGDGAGGASGGTGGTGGSSGGKGGSAGSSGSGGSNTSGTSSGGAGGGTDVGGNDSGGAGAAGEGGADGLAGAGGNAGAAGSGEGGVGGDGAGGGGGEGGASPQACAPAFAKPAGVPGAIAVKEAAVLVAVYGAVGTQTYTCNATTVGAVTTYAWGPASVPSAELRDADCDITGSHYAGPTWKANDNSTVVGARFAGVSSAAVDSIQLLLLSAVGGATEGMFKSVTAIQRLDTVGGIAPTTACNAGNVNATAAVPYTANYYFYSGADIIPTP